MFFPGFSPSVGAAPAPALESYAPPRLKRRRPPEELPAMDRIAPALPSAPTAMPPMPPMGPPGGSMVPRTPGGDMVGPRAEARREDVAIPALPGRTGGARPYEPIAAAEYDHVMEGARNPDGSMEPKVKRNWKDIATNTLMGALKGAEGSPRDPIAGLIGGAGAGAIGTAISPQAGREWQFKEMYRPGLEADEQRREEREGRDWERDKRARAIESADADLDYTRTRTDSLRVQDELSRQEEARRGQLAQSQIALNQARQKAAETGKPQLTDRVNPETQEIERVAIYPNGDEWVIGGSAQAAQTAQRIDSSERIAGQNNETRRDIAEGRNQTSLRRTGMQQAGATGRTQMQIRSREAGAGKAGGKIATAADIDGFVEMMRREGKTVTPAEARARYKAAGYEVR